MTITIASGAAGLKGKAKAAEGQKLPSNLRVHLIPAEKESAVEFQPCQRIKDYELKYSAARPVP